MKDDIINGPMHKVEVCKCLKCRVIRSKSYRERLMVIVVGIASLAWLILRTGTKPSRIVYPCQRLAWTNVEVLGLIPVLGVIIKRRKVVYVLAVLVALTVSLSFQNKKNIVTKVNAANVSRVVRVTNTAATLGKSYSGDWNNRADQTVVNLMADEGIKALTGKTTVKDAWTYLFQLHNGGADYTPGEKIAVKINNNNMAYDSNCVNEYCPNLHPIRALVRQLTVEKGIPAANIIIYDETRGIANYQSSNLTSLGVVLDNGSYSCLNSSGASCSSSSDPLCLSHVIWDPQVKYLINMPLFRTHFVGWTLSYKNNMGNTCDPGGFHGSDFNWNRLIKLNTTTNSPIATKTILIFDDALYARTYGGPQGLPTQASNTLFLATDPRAADKVMLDYLNTLGAGIDLNVAYNYTIGATPELVVCEPNCPSTTPVPTSSPTPTPTLIKTPTPTTPLPVTVSPTAANTPVLSPTPAQSVPGDANGDTHVDGLDYVIWLNNYSRNVSGAAYGDFNNNSQVDGLDYVIWLNNYGI